MQHSNLKVLLELFSRCISCFNLDQYFWALVLNCYLVYVLISYEMLCKFFNCFESYIWLLRMKGSKATPF
jgi:hypothetical protein